MITSRPPARIAFLKDRLSALLAHFFSAATGERLNAIVAADWMEIIAPFPEQVIAAAVKDWLENNSKKPTPMEIKNLCVKYYGWKAWNDFTRAKKIANMLPSDPVENKNAEENKTQDEWRPPTPEEKERVRNIVQNMWRKKEDATI